MLAALQLSSTLKEDWGQQRVNPPSDRKLRLFACAAFRASGGGTWSGDSFWALTTAEKFADGELGAGELCEAHEHFPRDLIAEFLLRAGGMDAAVSLVRHLFPVHSDARGDADSAEIAALLRDVIGNPWRPVTLALPSPLTGIGLAIRRIADDIYDERRWGELPVLADALVDSGCEDETILAHLRGPGPHTRGCWAIDCVLGKE